MEATDSVLSQGGDNATTTVVSGPQRGNVREIAISEGVSDLCVRPKYIEGTHTLHQGYSSIVTTLPENSMPIELIAQRATSILFCLDHPSLEPRVDQYGRKQSKIPLQKRKPKLQVPSVRKANYRNAKATTPTGCTDKYPNVVKARFVSQPVNVSPLKDRYVEPLPKKYHSVGESCGVTRNSLPPAVLAKYLRDVAIGIAGSYTRETTVTIWGCSKNQLRKKYRGWCGSAAAGKVEPNDSEYIKRALGKQAAKVAAVQRQAVLKAAKLKAARAQAHANNLALEEAYKAAVAAGNASAKSAPVAAKLVAAASAIVAAQDSSDEESVTDEQRTGFSTADEADVEQATMNTNFFGALLDKSSDESAGEVVRVGRVSLSDQTSQPRKSLRKRRAATRKVPAKSNSGRFAALPAAANGYAINAQSRLRLSLRKIGCPMATPFISQAIVSATDEKAPGGVLYNVVELLLSSVPAIVGNRLTYWAFRDSKRMRVIVDDMVHHEQIRTHRIIELFFTELAKYCVDGIDRTLTNACNLTEHMKHEISRFVSDNDVDAEFELDDSHNMGHILQFFDKECSVTEYRAHTVVQRAVLTCRCYTRHFGFDFNMLEKIWRVHLNMIYDVGVENVRRGMTLYNTLAFDKVLDDISDYVKPPTTTDEGIMSSHRSLTLSSASSTNDLREEPGQLPVVEVSANVGVGPIVEQPSLRECLPPEEETLPCVSRTRIVNWLAAPVEAEPVQPTVEVMPFVISSALPAPDLAGFEQENTKSEPEKAAEFLSQLASPALEARAASEETVARRERRVRTARILRMHCVASLGRLFITPGILTPEELELYDQIPKLPSGLVVPCPKHSCRVFHKNYYDEVKARCSFKATPDPTFTPTSVMRHVVSEIRRGAVNTNVIEQTTNKSSVETARAVETVVATGSSSEVQQLTVEKTTNKSSVDVACADDTVVATGSSSEVQQLTVEKTTNKSSVDVACADDTVVATGSGSEVQQLTVEKTINNSSADTAFTVDTVVATGSSSGVQQLTVEATIAPAPAGLPFVDDDSDDDDRFMHSESSSILKDLMLSGSKPSCEFFGLDNVASTVQTDQVPITKEEPKPVEVEIQTSVNDLPSGAQQNSVVSTATQPVVKLSNGIPLNSIGQSSLHRFEFNATLQKEFAHSFVDIFVDGEHAEVIRDGDSVQVTCGTVITKYKVVRAKLFKPYEQPHDSIVSNCVGKAHVAFTELLDGSTVRFFVRLRHVSVAVVEPEANAPAQRPDVRYARRSIFGGLGFMSIMCAFLLLTPTAFAYQHDGFSSTRDWAALAKAGSYVCYSVPVRASGYFQYSLTGVLDKYSCIASGENCGIINLSGATVDEAGVVIDGKKVSYQHLCSGDTYYILPPVEHPQVLSIESPPYIEEDLTLYTEHMSTDSGDMHMSYTILQDWVVVMDEYQRFKDAPEKTRRNKNHVPNKYIHGGQQRFPCRKVMYWPRGTAGHIIALQHGGLDDVINCHIETSSMNKLKAATIEKDMENVRFLEASFRVMSLALEGDRPYASHFVQTFTTEEYECRYDFYQTKLTEEASYTKNCDVVKINGWTFSHYIYDLAAEGGYKLLELALATIHSYIPIPILGRWCESVEQFNKFTSFVGLRFVDMFSWMKTKLSNMSVAFGLKKYTEFANSFDLQLHDAMPNQPASFYFTMKLAVERFVQGESVFLVIGIPHGTKEDFITKGIQAALLQTVGDFQQLGASANNDDYKTIRTEVVAANRVKHLYAQFQVQASKNRVFSVNYVSLPKCRKACKTYEETIEAMQESTGLESSDAIMFAKVNGDSTLGYHYVDVLGGEEPEELNDELPADVYTFFGDEESDEHPAPQGPKRKDSSADHHQNKKHHANPPADNGVHSIYPCVCIIVLGLFSTKARYLIVILVLSFMFNQGAAHNYERDGFTSEYDWVLLAQSGYVKCFDLPAAATDYFYYTLVRSIDRFGCLSSGVDCKVKVADTLGETEAQVRETCSGDTYYITSGYKGNSSYVLHIDSPAYVTEKVKVKTYQYSDFSVVSYANISGLAVVVDMVVTKVQEIPNNVRTNLFLQTSSSVCYNSKFLVHAVESPVIPPKYGGAYDTLNCYVELAGMTKLRDDVFFSELNSSNTLEVSFRAMQTSVEGASLYNPHFIMSYTTAEFECSYDFYQNYQTGLVTYNKVCTVKKLAFWSVAYYAYGTVTSYIGQGINILLSRFHYNIPEVMIGPWSATVSWFVGSVSFAATRFVDAYSWTSRTIRSAAVTMGVKTPQKYVADAMHELRAELPRQDAVFYHTIRDVFLRAYSGEGCFLVIAVPPGNDVVVAELVNTVLRLYTKYIGYIHAAKRDDLIDSKAVLYTDTHVSYDIAVLENKHAHDISTGAFIVAVVDAVESEGDYTTVYKSQNFDCGTATYVVYNGGEHSWQFDTNKSIKGHGFWHFLLLGCCLFFATLNFCMQYELAQYIFQVSWFVVSWLLFLLSFANYLYKSVSRRRPSPDIFYVELANIESPPIATASPPSSPPDDTYHVTCSRVKVDKTLVALSLVVASFIMLNSFPVNFVPPVVDPITLKFCKCDGNVITCTSDEGDVVSQHSFWHDAGQSNLTHDFYHVSCDENNECTFIVYSKIHLTSTIVTKYVPDSGVVYTMVFVYCVLITTSAFLGNQDIPIRPLLLILCVLAGVPSGAVDLFCNLIAHGFGYDVFRLAVFLVSYVFLFANRTIGLGELVVVVLSLMSTYSAAFFMAFTMEPMGFLGASYMSGGVYFYSFGVKSVFVYTAYQLAKKNYAEVLTVVMVCSSPCPSILAAFTGIALRGFVFNFRNFDCVLANYLVTVPYQWFFGVSTVPTDLRSDHMLSPEEKHRYTKPTNFNEFLRPFQVISIGNIWYLKYLVLYHGPMGIISIGAPACFLPGYSGTPLLVDGQVKAVLSGVNILFEQLFVVSPIVVLATDDTVVHRYHLDRVAGFREKLPVFNTTGGSTKLLLLPLLFSLCYFVGYPVQIDTLAVGFAFIVGFLVVFTYQWIMAPTPYTVRVATKFVGSKYWCMFIALVGLVSARVEMNISSSEAHFRPEIVQFALFSLVIGLLIYFMYFHAWLVVLSGYLSAIYIVGDPYLYLPISWVPYGWALDGTVLTMAILLSPLRRVNVLLSVVVILSMWACGMFLFIRYIVYARVFLVIVKYYQLQIVSDIYHKTGVDLALKLWELPWLGAFVSTWLFETPFSLEYYSGLVQLKMTNEGYQLLVDEDVHENYVCCFCGVPGHVYKPTSTGCVSAFDESTSSVRAAMSKKRIYVPAQMSVPTMPNDPTLIEERAMAKQVRELEDIVKAKDALNQDMRTSLNCRDSLMQIDRSARQATHDLLSVTNRTLTNRAADAARLQGTYRNEIQSVTSKLQEYVMTISNLQTTVDIQAKQIQAMQQLQGTATGQAIQPTVATVADNTSQPDQTSDAQAPSAAAATSSVVSGDEDVFSFKSVAPRNFTVKADVHAPSKGLDSATLVTGSTFSSAGPGVSNTNQQPTTTPATSFVDALNSVPSAASSDSGSVGSMVALPVPSLSPAECGTLIEYGISLNVPLSELITSAVNGYVQAMCDLCAVLEYANTHNCKSHKWFITVSGILNQIGKLSPKGPRVHWYLAIIREIAVYFYTTAPKAYQERHSQIRALVGRVKQAKIKAGEIIDLTFPTLVSLESLFQLNADHTNYVPDNAFKTWYYTTDPVVVGFPVVTVDSALTINQIKGLFGKCVVFEGQYSHLITLVCDNFSHTPYADAKAAVIDAANNKDNEKYDNLLSYSIPEHGSPTSFREPPGITTLAESLATKVAVEKVAVATGVIPKAPPPMPNPKPQKNYVSKEAHKQNRQKPVTFTSKAYVSVLFIFGLAFGGCCGADVKNVYLEMPSFLSEYGYQITNFSGIVNCLAAGTPVNIWTKVQFDGLEDLATYHADEVGTTLDVNNYQQIKGVGLFNDPGLTASAKINKMNLWVYKYIYSKGNIRLPCTFKLEPFEVSVFDPVVAAAANDAAGRQRGNGLPGVSADSPTTESVTSPTSCGQSAETYGEGYYQPVCYRSDDSSAARVGSTYEEAVYGAGKLILLRDEVPPSLNAANYPPVKKVMSDDHVLASVGNIEVAVSGVRLSLYHLLSTVYVEWGPLQNELLLLFHAVYTGSSYELVVNSADGNFLRAILDVAGQSGIDVYRYDERCHPITVCIACECPVVVRLSVTAPLLPYTHEFPYDPLLFVAVPEGVIDSPAGPVTVRYNGIVHVKDASVPTNKPPPAKPITLQQQRVESMEVVNGLVRAEEYTDAFGNHVKRKYQPHRDLDGVMKERKLRAVTNYGSTDVYVVEEYGPEHVQPAAVPKRVEPATSRVDEVTEVSQPAIHTNEEPVTPTVGKPIEVSPSKASIASPDAKFSTIKPGVKIEKDDTCGDECEAAKTTARNIYEAEQERLRMQRRKENEDKVIAFAKVKGLERECKKHKYLLPECDALRQKPTVFTEEVFEFLIKEVFYEQVQTLETVKTERKKTRQELEEVHARLKTLSDQMEEYLTQYSGAKLTNSRNIYHKLSALVDSSFNETVEETPQTAAPSSRASPRTIYEKPVHAEKPATSNPKFESPKVRNPEVTPVNKVAIEKTERVNTVKTESWADAFSKVAGYVPFSKRFSAWYNDDEKKGREACEQALEVATRDYGISPILVTSLKTVCSGVSVYLTSVTPKDETPFVTVCSLNHVTCSDSSTPVVSFTGPIIYFATQRATDQLVKYENCGHHTEFVNHQTYPKHLATCSNNEKFVVLQYGADLPKQTISRSVPYTVNECNSFAFGLSPVLFNHTVHVCTSGHFADGVPTIFTIDQEEFVSSRLYETSSTYSGRGTIVDYVSQLKKVSTNMIRVRVGFGAQVYTTVLSRPWYLSVDDQIVDVTLLSPMNYEGYKLVGDLPVYCQVSGRLNFKEATIIKTVDSLLGSDSYVLEVAGVKHDCFAQDTVSYYMTKTFGTLTPAENVLMSKTKAVLQAVIVTLLSAAFSVLVGFRTSREPVTAYVFPTIALGWLFTTIVPFLCVYYLTVRSLVILIVIRETIYILVVMYAHPTVSTYWCVAASFAFFNNYYISTGLMSVAFNLFYLVAIIWVLFRNSVIYEALSWMALALNLHNLPFLIPIWEKPAGYNHAGATAALVSAGYTINDAGKLREILNGRYSETEKRRAAFYLMMLSIANRSYNLNAQGIYKYDPSAAYKIVANLEGGGDKYMQNLMNRVNAIMSVEVHNKARQQYVTEKVTIVSPTSLNLPAGGNVLFPDLKNRCFTISTGTLKLHGFQANPGKLWVPRHVFLENPISEAAYARRHQELQVQINDGKSICKVYPDMYSSQAINVNFTNISNYVDGAEMWEFAVTGLPVCALIPFATMQNLPMDVIPVYLYNADSQAAPWFVANMTETGKIGANTAPGYCGLPYFWHTIAGWELVGLHNASTNHYVSALRPDIFRPWDTTVVTDIVGASVSLETTPMGRAATAITGLVLLLDPLVDSCAAPSGMNIAECAAAYGHGSVDVSQLTDLIAGMTGRSKARVFGQIYTVLADRANTYNTANVKLNGVSVAAHAQLNGPEVLITQYLQKSGAYLETAEVPTGDVFYKKLFMEGFLFCVHYLASGVRIPYLFPVMLMSAILVRVRFGAKHVDTMKKRFARYVFQHFPMFTLIAVHTFPEYLETELMRGIFSFMVFMYINMATVLDFAKVVECVTVLGYRALLKYVFSLAVILCYSALYFNYSYFDCYVIMNAISSPITVTLQLGLARWFGSTLVFLDYNYECHLLVDAFWVAWLHIFGRGFVDDVWVVLVDTEGRVPNGIRERVGQVLTIREGEKSALSNLSVQVLNSLLTYGELLAHTVDASVSRAALKAIESNDVNRQWQEIMNFSAYLLDNNPILKSVVEGTCSINDMLLCLETKSDDIEAVKRRSTEYLAAVYAGYIGKIISDRRDTLKPTAQDLSQLYKELQVSLSEIPGIVKQAMGGALKDAKASEVNVFSRQLKEQRALLLRLTAMIKAARADPMKIVGAYNNQISSFVANQLDEFLTAAGRSEEPISVESTPEELARFINGLNLIVPDLYNLLGLPALDPNNKDHDLLYQLAHLLKYAADTLDLESVELSDVSSDLSMKISTLEQEIAEVNLAVHPSKELRKEQNRIITAKKNELSKLRAQYRAQRVKDSEEARLNAKQTKLLAVSLTKAKNDSSKSEEINRQRAEGYSKLVTLLVSLSRQRYRTLPSLLAALGAAVTETPAELYSLIFSGRNVGVDLNDYNLTRDSTITYRVKATDFGNFTVIDGTDTAGCPALYVGPVSRVQSIPPLYRVARYGQLIDPDEIRAAIKQKRVDDLVITRESAYITREASVELNGFDTRVSPVVIMCCGVKIECTSKLDHSHSPVNKLCRNCIVGSINDHVLGCAACMTAFLRRYSYRGCSEKVGTATDYYIHSMTCQHCKYCRACGGIPRTQPDDPNECHGAGYHGAKHAFSGCSQPGCTYDHYDAEAMMYGGSTKRNYVGVINVEPDGDAFKIVCNGETIAVITSLPSDGIVLRPIFPINIPTGHKIYVKSSSVDTIYLMAVLHRYFNRTVSVECHHCARSFGSVVDHLYLVESEPNHPAVTYKGRPFRNATSIVATHPETLVECPKLFALPTKAKYTRNDCLFKDHSSHNRDQCKICSQPDDSQMLVHASVPEDKRFIWAYTKILAVPGRTCTRCQGFKPVEAGKCFFCTADFRREAVKFPPSQRMG